MTKRIYRAIILVTLTVLMAALILSMGALYSHFTQVQYTQLREETALAAHAVTHQGISYFEDLSQKVSCRITWIGADGTVLYDSRSDYGAMENHLQREEIRQALDSGYGRSARYSGTLFQRYLYSAQRLPDGTVLRLSLQQSSVADLVLELLRFILLILALAAGWSLFLASRLSRSIVKPINELNLDDPMSNKEYEEIYPLLRRLESQQSQLKLQALALEQRQKEFHTVTKSLSEGLVLLGSNSTILSINPSAAQLLEVTPNCVGADFSVANQNPEIAILVEHALQGRKEEATISLPLGNYLASASPVKTADGISGVVLLLLDVTQKQKAEQLRREFTANVSHELKTPLHAISGYAELMQSGLVPQADMQVFSGKIYGEAQRLIRLVEDILRLSRLDEGAADLQRRNIDLYRAAQDALQELAASAELSGIALHLEGSHAVISSIPQLLSGILLNLVDNAIKYNRKQGSVTIQITDLCKEVLLTVEDTGIGIPAGDQERIFERFYRVDKSHSKEVGGTGLGLSIVKHAASVLGAKISLRSSIGKGTTVTVRFPK